jgi:hypothetical protein
MNVTGMTLQVGGPHLIACDKGLADDREWFRRNIARSYRVRFPLGAEHMIKRGYPRGVTVLIAVRQVRRGSRIRLDVGWRGPLRPLNSERFARQAFEVAAERSPWAAELERRIREE